MQFLLYLQHESAAFVWWQMRVVRESSFSPNKKRGACEMAITVRCYAHKCCYPERNEPLYQPSSLRINVSKCVKRGENYKQTWPQRRSRVCFAVCRSFYRSLLRTHAAPHWARLFFPLPFAVSSISVNTSDARKVNTAFSGSAPGENKR